MITLTGVAVVGLGGGLRERRVELRWPRYDSMTNTMTHEVLRVWERVH